MSFRKIPVKTNGKFGVIKLWANSAKSVYLLIKKAKSQILNFQMAMSTIELWDFFPISNYYSVSTIFIRVFVATFIVLRVST